MLATTKPKSSALNRYKKARKAYLLEHPVCEVRGCGKPSEQIHHERGRIGDLLTNDKYFLAVCAECHQKIERFPKWAKEQGYSQSRLKNNI